MQGITVETKTNAIARKILPADSVTAATTLTGFAKNTVATVAKTKV